MKSSNCLREPSLYYLVIAESCFHQAKNTDHPSGSDTLREIGRDYLRKARHDAPSAIN